MSLPRFAFVLSVLVLAQPQSFWAQQDAGKPQPPDSVITNDFVQKEFGTSCTLMGIQPLVADFNGDGVEDIVIPARCRNPMSDQSDKNFVVLDPYYTFFGYGNPKVTTGFSTDIPEDRALALLVIHGSGPEAWRSPTPLAKFVIVNLPYKGVTVKKFQIRRKKLMAIYVEEKGADQMTSALFWDGKRYRYEPMGSSME
ncbi:MAG: FG-GAP repeat protein [Terriglobales bacterium]